jgi:hypothetical protein
MSSAAAVAREGLAHHDHLLSLFSSTAARTPSRPTTPPRAPLAGIDLAREAVIEGRVVRGTTGVHGAYVRLLDAAGAFVAEVPADADGAFRFFAEPGRWTVRVQVDGAVVHAAVEAVRGSVSDVVVQA